MMTDLPERPLLPPLIEPIDAPVGKTFDCYYSVDFADNLGERPSGQLLEVEISTLASAALKKAASSQL